MTKYILLLHSHSDIPQTISNNAVWSLPSHWYHFRASAKSGNSRKSRKNQGNGFCLKCIRKRSGDSANAKEIYGIVREIACLCFHSMNQSINKSLNQSINFVICFNNPQENAIAYARNEVVGFHFL